jgi:hypothetical protein
MFDSIDLPGYVFKSKHRKNVARMRSGGILLGFRENLVTNSGYLSLDLKPQQFK